MEPFWEKGSRKRLRENRNSLDFDSLSNKLLTVLKYDKTRFKSSECLITRIMEKRVIFPKSKQREFLTLAKKELSFTWPEFAKIIGINRGTLEKAYRYEVCSMPYNVFLNIIKLINMNESYFINLYDAKVIDFKQVIGRKCLGEKRKILSTNTNIIYIKSAQTFDTSSIRLDKTYGKNKDIKFPDKLTSELAEEIGMHVGDGFLSAKRYEYRLKGNKNEREYYDKFIRTLFKRLYNVDINLKDYETTYGFELYSKSLWIFKSRILGIPAGRKNDMAFPEVIKVNNQEILTAFIRGVFDTDGSVSFIKKYKTLGNYYPVISLTLKSKKLIIEIKEILAMFGLEPRSSFDGDYYRIDLNGYKRLEVYSKLIGWHNPKHLRKVIKWKDEYPELGKDVMVDVV